MILDDERTTTVPAILSLSSVGLGDLAIVGGKNSSLGEMLRELTTAGVRVPDGFATSAEAFRRHMSASGLTEWISQSTLR